MLGRLRFDAAVDQVWFAGDLINRGPQSLGVLRFVQSLGAAARTVLGNHELHLLAIHYGGHPPRRADTLDAILTAPDRADIADWLRSQPFLLEHAATDTMLVHAGVPHIWSLAATRAHALELTAALQDPAVFPGFFKAMYGDRPDTWSPSLTGIDRLRLVANYFTRMRLIASDGRLEFNHKGALSNLPPGFEPWFAQLADADSLPCRLLFGHWAALEGHTGNANVVALDTGCVWGRFLTALCLETGEIERVPASVSSI